MPGVSKPEFSRAKSSGVLDSCNKNGLLKSHFFTGEKAPRVPRVPSWGGIHPSLPPRQDRCLPNLAAAELARPWDLGVASGGDIPIPRPPCAPWRFFGDGK